MLHVSDNHLYKLGDSGRHSPPHEGQTENLPLASGTVGVKRAPSSSFRIWHSKLSDIICLSRAGKTNGIGVYDLELKYHEAFAHAPTRSSLYSINDSTKSGLSLSSSNSLLTSFTRSQEPDKRPEHKQHCNSPRSQQTTPKLFSRTTHKRLADPDTEWTVEST